MPRRRLSRKQKALARLHAQIRQCDRCPLWKTRTQAVPGIGLASANIMLVGEAPGRQEDLRGEPFVGAAGRFLDELLASVGLSRGAVYITNVVKSRPVSGPPPGPSTELRAGGAGRNRAPAPEEIAACTPWLDEQLRIIRPKVVVTLGRIALEYFQPRAKISKMHGRPFKKGRTTFLPLYHPAMALYRRDWIAMLRKDFRRLARMLKQRS